MQLSVVAHTHSAAPATESEVVAQRDLFPFVTWLGG